MTIEADVLEVLIFRVGRSEDFSRGKEKLLWQLSSFKELKSRLVLCRTNIIPWTSFMETRNVYEAFRHCPMTRYECSKCPYRIEGETPVNPEKHSNTCVLFKLRNRGSDIFLSDLMDSIDDIITRADKYAKEQGWS